MAEEKTTAKTVKAKKPEEKDNRVPYFIPYIEGEGPDVTVGLNGKMYKIQRGVQVMIPRGVAQILDHSNAQKYAAAKRRESLKNIDMN